MINACLLSGEKEKDGGQIDAIDGVLPQFSRKVVS
jgi:hypothetical protein